VAFYYVSLFSIVPLGVAYAVMALLYWFVWRASREARQRGLVRSVAAVALLILPVGEELWVAWSFGQACKHAGTFIREKVQVEGLYDDTTEWGPRQLQESGYRYVESRGNLRNGLFRVEQIHDDAAKRQALEWYAQRNPDKARPAHLYVVQPVDDSEQIIVSPDETATWRRSKVERLTARYQFKNTDPMNGTRWAHKIGRSGAVVIDSQTNEEIARYTSFGREPPWFYIGLGVPPYACDAPGRWPLTRGNPLIYREVLVPLPKR